MFKKTFEVAGCGFFERADDQLNNYSIKNIVGDIQNERKQKLDLLLSFIGKIENFIKDFINKTEVAIKECQEKINKKNIDFFKEKIKEIKKEYDLEIQDRNKSVDIANEYKEKLKGKTTRF